MALLLKGQVHFHHIPCPAERFVQFMNRRTVVTILSWILILALFVFLVG